MSCDFAGQLQNICQASVVCGILKAQVCVCLLFTALFLSDYGSEFCRFCHHDHPTTGTIISLPTVPIRVIHPARPFAIKLIDWLVVQPVSRLVGWLVGWSDG